MNVRADELRKLWNALICLLAESLRVFKVLDWLERKL